MAVMTDRDGAGGIRREASDTGTAVVELRRYRLHPGKRETLIDLFDREFVETQEAVGMRVIGQFRDLDAPNDFVWLRGFADMQSRAAALQTFYAGPVWATHKDVANGTMINSDNVLLLRPATPQTGFAAPTEERPRPAGPHGQPGLIVATICYLAPRTDGAFATFFEETLQPLLRQASATVLAAFVTEKGPNTFPRLPVREGETVFAWLSSFPGLPAYESHLAALARSDEWVRKALPEMDRRTWRPNEVSRLMPTGRSLLHG
ncbi:NIPSNAP family protein [Microvirga sp. TS319]|uniref:NIPSNAP family protein n=1 Tax=Microvirga sp. TS319 TaxID=3241165 RepID=UPI00351A6800